MVAGGVHAPRSIAASYVGHFPFTSLAPQPRQVRAVKGQITHSGRCLGFAPGVTGQPRRPGNRLTIRMRSSTLMPSISGQVWSNCNAVILSTGSPFAACRT